MIIAGNAPCESGATPWLRGGITVNELGQVVWNDEVSDDHSATSTLTPGIMAYDPILGMRALMREGWPLRLADGRDLMVRSSGRSRYASRNGWFDRMAQPLDQRGRMVASIRAPGGSVLVRVPIRCGADLSADGVVDASDVSAFERAFIAGEPEADLDPDGVLDMFDAASFADRLAARC